MSDDFNDTEVGQDNLQISDQERLRIVSILNKMLEMGIGSIYGQEEEGLHAAPSPLPLPEMRCNKELSNITLRSLSLSPETLKDTARTLTTTPWNAQSGMTDP